MRAHLSRRHLLLGAAGALSLPLLHSLAPGGTRPALGAPLVFPKRIVLFYNPNGTVTQDWFPAKGATEEEFTLGPIHAPLKKYQQKLLLVKGVNNSVGQDPANYGGPHQRGIGGLFTGQMLLEGNFADGCGSKAGWAAGRSIDQAIAAAIGADTPFRSLELGVRTKDNDVQGRISYTGSGQPLPPSADPTEVYNRLFFRAEPLDANDPNSRKQSIIDTVKGQFGTLNRNLGQDDREKLEKHLSLVEDLERRLGLKKPDQTSQCTQPNAPEIQEMDSEETMPAISRTQLDLLVTALACDLTRVASVQYSTGFNRIRYPWLDDLGEGHSLSHSGGSNTQAWDALSRRATWHAGELAYFADQLAAIPEGEGSLLDNTLILWGNEVSQGNTHSLNDIPYLMLGDAGGALRAGRYIEYTNASNCDYLHAILQAFGVDEKTFGNTSYSGGVLSGLLA